MGGNTKSPVEAIFRGSTAVVLELEECLFKSRVMDRRAKSHLWALVSSNINVSGHIENAWENRNV